MLKLKTIAAATLIALTATGAQAQEMRPTDAAASMLALTDAPEYAHCEKPVSEETLVLLSLVVNKETNVYYEIMTERIRAGDGPSNCKVYAVAIDMLIAMGSK